MADWDASVICIVDGRDTDVHYTVVRIRYNIGADAAGTYVCQSYQCRDTATECPHLDLLMAHLLEGEDVATIQLLKEQINKKCKEERAYYPRCLSKTNISFFPQSAPLPCQTNQEGQVTLTPTAVECVCGGQWGPTKEMGEIPVIGLISSYRAKGDEYIFYTFMYMQ